MNCDLAVVGGGAAGLLAASRAAELGQRVLVLEKNRKPGVKILMSGGTRCNLTHATDRLGIVTAFGKPGQFLHSALAALGPSDLVDLFHREGVRTKTEPTGKVFPVSNRAKDVLDALLLRLNRSGAELILSAPVTDWHYDGTAWILHTAAGEVAARQVLLSAGGQSYPGCGTTGDGYRLVRKLGIEVVPPRPALVPLTLADRWAKELSGVALPDVHLRVQEVETRKVLDERRGGFLFTHFGCSGPAPMDASKAIASHAEPPQLHLLCDWLPHLSTDDLRQMLQTAPPKQAVLGWLAAQVPSRLAERLLVLAEIPSGQALATLGRKRGQRLVEVLKSCPLTPTGTLGFKKAEVTAGGVALAEVDSRTLRCKKLPSLLLAGEVLDLDGPIGGYNFQAAFSTGWLAGSLKS